MFVQCFSVIGLIVEIVSVASRKIPHPFPHSSWCLFHNATMLNDLIAKSGEKRKFEETFKCSEFSYFSFISDDDEKHCYQQLNSIKSMVVLINISISL